MPYRKRYVRRKKNYRKRPFKRSAVKPKFGGKIKQPVHYFKRYVDLGTVNSDAGTPETVGVFNFGLDDVPGYTEFTALYDSYKLVAVKIMFLPYSDQTQASGALDTFAFERMFTAIDYNDGTAPANINALREYNNCKVTRNNVIHKRFLYPKCEIDSDFQMGKNPWINTDKATVAHYGIKYGFEQTSTNQARWRVEAVYYLKFKARK